MKRNHKLLLTSAVIVFGVFLWERRVHDIRDSHDFEATRIEKEKRVWDVLFATPVDFYGKVVDEKDNPIPDADVVFSFANSLMGGSPKKNKTTDASGCFHLSGHGLGVIVEVSKTGYYNTKKSKGMFGYSKTAGQIDPHPKADNPAIFVLQKAGTAVPLIYQERRIRTSKIGNPVEINLASGQLVPNGKGDIKVETWTQDSQPNDFRYDWRCRISIPGGGLIPRAGEFDFEAPANGYAPYDEISMPASMGSDWSANTKRQYFLKLANGRYARIDFKMIAEGNHYFVLSSYLNPQAGSRNLEFDPAKQINPL